MSNFICEKCGMTNIDCGYQGYKTEREIELEKQLDREIHINRKMKKALEKYAFENTKMEIPNWIGNSLQLRNELDIFTPVSLVNEPEFDGVKEIEIPYANDTSLAQQVLKEIEEME